MSNVVPFNPAQLPAHLATEYDEQEANELGAGIQAGFPVMSFRGRVWRIKAKGEEHIVRDTEGEPRASIDLVFLAANSALSKIYYAEAYNEGDDSPPSCWSLDGVKPDPQVENPCAVTCGACANNVWGSKITPQGTKVKACADSKRLAVVPAGDLLNERFGGPMLLRVPAASLQGLLQYNMKLASQKIPFYGVVTRLRFDLNASYPKLECEPSAFLTADQLDTVKLLRDSDDVQRILATMADDTHDPGTPIPRATVAPPAPTPGIVTDPAPEPEPVPPAAPPAPEPVTPPPTADLPPEAIFDSVGTQWDPSVHATAAAGGPSYKKDGTFRKKRVAAAAAPAAAPEPAPEPAPPAAPPQPPAASPGNGTASSVADDVENLLGSLLDGA